MGNKRVRHYSELNRTELDELLDTALAELVGDNNGDLSMRMVNILERKSIYTVRDLLNITRKDLYRIRGLGPTAFNAIFAALANIGFYNQPSLKAPK